MCMYKCISSCVCVSMCEHTQRVAYRVVHLRILGAYQRACECMWPVCVHVGADELRFAGILCWRMWARVNSRLGQTQMG